jgi:hypothetical protein
MGRGDSSSVAGIQLARKKQILMFSEMTLKVLDEYMAQYRPGKCLFEGAKAGLEKS